MTRGFRTRGKRSKFESRVADALGDGWEYETHRLPYQLNNMYVPDFTRHMAGKGYDLHIEAKGRFTSSDRRKMLAAKAANPAHEIRIVLMRDQKLYKGSPTTYSQWCTKHGFKNSVFPALPFTPEELKTLCAASPDGGQSPRKTVGAASGSKPKLRRQHSTKPKNARRGGSTKTATAVTSSKASSTSER